MDTGGCFVISIAINLMRVFPPHGLYPTTPACLSQELPHHTSSGQTSIPGARGSIVNPVFSPGTANDTAQADAKLRQARDAVKLARENHDGIFDSSDPLRLSVSEKLSVAVR